MHAIPGLQSLVAGYPRAERARGYLLGVTAATGGEVGPAGGEPGEEPDQDADDGGVSVAGQRRPVAGPRRAGFTDGADGTDGLW